jgi:hypothetical protein
MIKERNERSGLCFTFEEDILEEKINLKTVQLCTADDAWVWWWSGNESEVGQDVEGLVNGGNTNEGLDDTVDSACNFLILSEGRGESLSELGNEVTGLGTRARSDRSAWLASSEGNGSPVESSGDEEDSS